MALSQLVHVNEQDCVSLYRMGGDRDGNPYVTPATTRDVVITARLAATNLYFKTVEVLMYELSVWRCSDEARVRSHGWCPCLLALQWTCCKVGAHAELPMKQTC